jgi:uncharacterized protein
MAYIGRVAERAEFRRLLVKKTASLVTVQGRRRIGKSRLIRECGQEADLFLTFSGLAPYPNQVMKDQLKSFASQLAQQTSAPRVTFADWAAAFQLLANQLPHEGTAMILLDEISWMAQGDPGFSGELKNAWDLHFSKRPQLIVVLCGSVSSWIEENVLRNTGFVGRSAWSLNLGPLSLSECAEFWGKKGDRISSAEKLRVLSITGGVPRYLEEIDPARTAEQNISTLCFQPGAMLVNEFESIFHDIFSRKAASYREIVRSLVAGPQTLDQISSHLRRERGGSLGEALADLMLAGFVRQDVPFDPETGVARSREARFRLFDPFLRFHLKYIEPNQKRIAQGLLREQELERLEGWDAMMGLQFEALILANVPTVLSEMKVSPKLVLNHGPYVQRQTLRRKGCQIDLLIRTRRCLYIFEIKFRQQIEAGVISEVEDKVAALKLPRGQSFRTGLIYEGALSPQIEASEFFDYLIPAEKLLRRLGAESQAAEPAEPRSLVVRKPAVKKAAQRRK